MRVLVIGGGIGGYVCAIRLSQLGARVTLAERKWIGGTCLNDGCVPTKALLSAAEALETIRKAGTMGIRIPGEPAVDFGVLQAHKQAVVDQLVSGVVKLLDNGQVIRLEEDVRITGPGKARIGSEEQDFDVIVAATGSEPVRLPIPGIDEDHVVDSTGILNLTDIPESLLIIGGGVIGTEIGSLYHSMGTKVTIVELMPEIVPTMDSSISQMLRMNLERKGIRIFTEAGVRSIVRDKDGLTVQVDVKGQDREFFAQYVLYSTGRRPVTDVLGDTPVKMNGRFIAVDDRMETSVSGIYAIGDVTGKSLLAHTAAEQGLTAANAIMGQPFQPIRYDIIPSCLYTHPEAASVGLTEQECEKRGLKTKTGIFPLFNNARSLIHGEIDETFVKMITDERTDEVLGVHIFAPGATELIAEAALALALECTAQEIAELIHPHPTVSEGIKEAAESALGHAIHSLE